MAAKIDAATLKGALSDRREIALIDVREHGQFGEGHLFFAVPLAYSRFELGLPALVPNASVRLVLCDAGDGVAERAALRAEALGYSNVAVLAGGVAGLAGRRLHALCRRQCAEQDLRRTRRSGAPYSPPNALLKSQAMREAKANVVIVDGRPFAEYSKMNIPGGICCPNGELRFAHPRYRPRSKTQDHRQLCRPHALDHRRANADRFRRSQSRLRARERHARLVSGRAAARARRQPSWRSGRARTGRRPTRGARTRSGAKPRRRNRDRGRRASLARRGPPHHLLSRRAQSRRVCRCRACRASPCAGRPADPGDGPVGRRQGRAAGADRR